MEPLELSYTATAEDYTRTNRTMTLRHPLYLILIAAGGLLAGASICTILGAIVLSLIEAGRTIEPSVLIRLLAGTVLFLVFPVHFLLLNPRQISQRYLKLRGGPEHNVWLVDEECLQITTPQAKNRLEWDTFGKAVETKGYFLLIYATNKNAFQFIPKWALESAQQEADFRRYIE